MQNGESFEMWFKEKLSNLLGFPAGNDLINYILSFESERDIKEYFKTLLDLNQPKSKEFFDEFLKRWKPPLDNYRMYNKKETLSAPSENIKYEELSQKKIKAIQGAINGGKNLEISHQDALPIQMERKVKHDAKFIDKNCLSSNEINQIKGANPFKRRNFKYVPLYSADGKLKTDTILLPGRHACQCLAQKHKLINNCFQCGRIVCEQEGSGPCIFCENLVCSLEEQEIICRESKKSKKLKEKLMSQIAEVIEEEKEEEKVNAGLQKALAQKDRLLEFDKNSTKRTKVIDDEADYFSTNSRWLSKKQKEALAQRDKEIRDQRFKSVLDKRIRVDFLGREVYESTEDNFVYNGEDDDVIKTIEHDNKSNNLTVNTKNHPLIDPRILIEPPQFQSNCFKADVKLPSNTQQKEAHRMIRLQDKELQEVVDQGMCLSMHQPWASLLVYGIKKIEGRSWYTAHRGRLWIAATAKEPEKEQIQQVENQYRMFYPDKVFDFPKNYPSGCLIGCVNIMDCLSNNDYFNSHPGCKEESSSEYLFVCENPQHLKVMFSMKGHHKIYKLDAQHNNLLIFQNMSSMLESCLNKLKLSCTTEEYKETAKLLFIYIDNIFKNKSCEKYKKIRIANEKFNKYVWCFESCRTLLLLCGFEQDNQFLTLPVNVDVSQIHSILLNEMIEMNILQSMQSLHENEEEKKILNIRSKDDKSMFQEEVKPDMTLLSYLVEMGYAKNVAVKGLIATSNVGVQPAMDWIELHPECYFSTTIQSGDNSSQSSVSNTSSEFIDGVQPYKDVISSRYSRSLDEKHKFQEKQRLELIKRTKVEKAEEIRARQNLKMNLESEKKQKLEKFEQEKLLRHLGENKTTDENQLLKCISHDVIMLRIKLQNGFNIDWETNRNTSLKFLYNYVSEKTNMAVNEFEVVIPHLNKVLKNSQELTLEQEGLYPNGIVAIQMVKATSISGDPLLIDTMTDN